MKRKTPKARTAERSHPDAALFALRDKIGDARLQAVLLKRAARRAVNKLPEPIRYVGSWAVAAQNLNGFVRGRESHLTNVVYRGQKVPADEQAILRRMKRLARLANAEAMRMWDKAFKARRRSGARGLEDRAGWLGVKAGDYRDQLLATPAKTAEGIQLKWCFAETPTERMTLVNELFAIAPDILPLDHVAAAIVNTQGKMADYPDRHAQPAKRGPNKPTRKLGGRPAKAKACEAVPAPHVVAKVQGGKAVRP